MHQDKEKQRRLVILVVGLSGAGKTTVLHTFEDNRFDVIDGLPFNLLTSIIIPRTSSDIYTPIAIGIDTSKEGFSVDKFGDLFDNLSEHPQIDLRLLYLDCEDKELIRRYTETRRKHPHSRDCSLETGILKERESLFKLQQFATDIIDTTELNSNSLKKLVEKIFTKYKNREMVVTVMSFSYRNGIPQEADIVLDVRCLRNPHYDEKLRFLTGLDSSVGDYIKQDKDYELFMLKVEDLLNLLLPKYVEEGKSYLTIAIGCTGGRHRSVYISEELAKKIALMGYETISRHREIGH